MRNFLLAIVAMSVLAATANAQLAESIQNILYMFDEYLLQGVWRPMIFYTITNNVYPIVCSMFGLQLISLTESMLSGTFSGFSLSDAQSKVTDVDTICSTAFINAYWSVWFGGKTPGSVKYAFGDLDQFNYTP